MKHALAAALYDTVCRLALPLVFLRLWWRGAAEPAYRSAWRQRLGWWSPSDASGALGGGPRIWLHAVSLGETRAAAPLVSALRALIPQAQFVLTAGTATGLQAGRELLAPGDQQGWLPLDTPGATRRFFRAVQPDVGILMETETWPNLLKAAQEQGVPVVLANARLSERSLRKGLRWAALSRPMMGRMAAVLAQSDEDARRLLQAGVAQERVAVMGNLKYDLSPEPALLELGRTWAAALAHQGLQRPVVLAASWREGEDEPLLRAWHEQVVQAAVPIAQRPLLLLVPRHPQRFGEVRERLLAQGFTVSARSLWPSSGPGVQDLQADVWLGDSLGEMAAYYACARVALLGGSFEALGGQNLIEAAACACPLVMGPHTFNFEEAAKGSLEAGAAWRSGSVHEALQWALALDEPQRQRMSTAAERFSAGHAGAAARMAQAIVQRLQGCSSRGESAWTSADPKVPEA